MCKKITSTRVIKTLEGVLVRPALLVLYGKVASVFLLAGLFALYVRFGRYVLRYEVLWGGFLNLLLFIGIVMAVNEFFKFIVIKKEGVWVSSLFLEKWIKKAELKEVVELNNSSPAQVVLKGGKVLTFYGYDGPVLTTELRKWLHGKGKDIAG